MKTTSMKSVAFKTAHELTAENFSRTFEYVGEYKQVFRVMLKRVHASFKNPIARIRAALGLAKGCVRKAFPGAISITKVVEGDARFSAFDYATENGLKYKSFSYLHDFDLQNIAEGSGTERLVAKFQKLRDYPVIVEVVKGKHTVYYFFQV